MPFRHWRLICVGRWLQVFHLSTHQGDTRSGSRQGPGDTACYSRATACNESDPVAQNVVGKDFCAHVVFGVSSAFALSRFD
jgi:hypothetical protein